MNGNIQFLDIALNQQKEYAGEAERRRAIAEARAGAGPSVLSRLVSWCGRRRPVRRLDQRQALRESPLT